MAARSLNKVTLIGNLTRDPELRYTPQGTAVCQFGLATNRDWVTANGEKKEDVQYHRIVAWSKLAELCSQLLAKGSKVFVEGRIVYRSFEGKDGTQKAVTEIIMDNMILLSAGKNSAPRVQSTDAPKKEEKHPTSLKKEETEVAEPVVSTVAEDEIQNVDDKDIPF